MLRVRIFRPITLWICLGLSFVTWSPIVFGQGNAKAEYQVYACRYKTAATMEKLLADLLPDDPSVHLVVDTKSNSLLLRGPEEVQAVAKSLLEHVDQPAAPESSVSASQPAASRPVVRAYACAAAEIDRWMGVVRAVCGTRSDVKVTASRATNQLIVLAPPDLHQYIAQRMAEGLRPSTPSQPAESREVADRGPPSDPAVGPPAPSLPAAANSGADTAVSSPPLPLAATPEVDRVLHLRSLQTDGIEQRLIALFGRRLLATQRNGHDIYILPIDERQAIEFQLDRSRNVVLVRGAQPQVAQFVQLVDALDSSGQRGLKTRAVHVERTAPNQLRQAVDAYRGRTDPLPTTEPGRDDQAHRVPPEGVGAVRLVSYVFQQQPGGGDTGGAAGLPDDMGTVVPNVPGLADLEVQTLPDLDVIILRGRDQDVEQLTKIIRELERLSVETKPRIYIYPLKHVQGESVSDIIEQVQTDLVGRRQGRVTVTPLTKPNSLLLIGWGEAVEAIIELISKLDRPVPPESQFSVFSLKHAAATTVQQTIQQFFGSRPGLGPQVQLAVDSRTNSLIAYAAPRDMREVERLVRELDIAKSGAVNRAQIFRVYNALATDLADTLDQAITASQAGQSGRSAVLELLAVDEAGQQIIRSGMLNEVNITPNPRNNTLIVTGPPEAIPLIEAFIEQLDAPGDRAQIKVFRVLNGDATNLVSMLRSLMPSQVGQTLGPQLPSGLDEESLAPLRFSVEVRSNSIIAIGSEGDLRIVEAIFDPPRSERVDEPEKRHLPAEELTGRRRGHLHQPVPAKPTAVGSGGTRPVQSVPGSGTRSDCGSRTRGKSTDCQCDTTVL